MRKIIVNAFMSLDGVIQGIGAPQEDTSGGFELGGWVVPLSDAATGSTVQEIYRRPFELVLGRKTYDIWVKHWPHITHPDDPFAAAINAAPKHVASRGTPQLQWHNSRLLEGDVATALRKLKSADGPDLLVPGSADLLQTLWRHGLVDECILLTYPVILGRGKRLFGEGAAPLSWQLVTSQTSSTGVIIAHYAVAGAVRTGRF